MIEERNKDKDILKALLNKRVYEVLNNKVSVYNNAYRLLKLLKKEYLIEETKRIIDDY